MKKNRLEAFSDGVFAIVITLLILEVKLPEVSYDELYQSLLNISPSVGAYVLSFFLIGMYWVFHHYSFAYIGEVDGVLLWLNIIFLLFITFLPFPTMMMGRYPFQTLPIVIYGINLLLANMNGFIMTVYLNRNRQLTTSIFTDKVYKKQMRTYLVVNSLYLVCIGLAFVIPAVSLILVALIALVSIIRTILMMRIGRGNKEAIGNYSQHG